MASAFNSKTAEVSITDFNSITMPILKASSTVPRGYLTYLNPASWVFVINLVTTATTVMVTVTLVMTATAGVTTTTITVVVTITHFTIITFTVTMLAH